MVSMPEMVLSPESVAESVARDESVVVVSDESDAVVLVLSTVALALSAVVLALAAESVASTGSAVGSAPKPVLSCDESSEVSESGMPKGAETATSSPEDESRFRAGAAKRQSIHLYRPPLGTRGES